MFVTFGWLISASAIVGNGILIYLIAFRQRLRSGRPNWFVLSLAVADLFVGATYFPYNRGCNDTRCSQMHIHWLCVDLFLSASVTNLCLLTVDRYISIVKPLQYLTFATKLESCPCNNSSLVIANPYRPFTFVMDLYTFADGD